MGALLVIGVVTVHTHLAIIVPILEVPTALILEVVAVVILAVATVVVLAVEIAGKVSRKSRHESVQNFCGLSCLKLPTNRD